MVVSSAIKDAGLSVSAYFMLNAAVAMESYDGTIITNTLRHPDWQNYSNRLWASEWHALFSTNDGRGNLTWRGKFSGFSSAYNYFSSTEDVLDNADGDVPSLFDLPERSWVMQEMRKGTTVEWITGNAEAGWGFNGDYSGLSVAQANALSNSVLQTNAFFRHFDDEDLYATNGSAVAQQPATYRQLLADAIPALSNPMGRNEMGGWGASRNRDYMTQGGGSGFRRGTYPSGWPRSENDWRHSDIKNIAYPYNRNLFDKIVGDGGLQQ
jgi:hypothetical protein